MSDIDDLSGFAKPTPRLSDNLLAELETDVGDSYNEFATDLQAYWLQEYPELLDYIEAKTGQNYEEDGPTQEMIEEVGIIFDRLLHKYIGSAPDDDE